MVTPFVLRGERGNAESIGLIQLQRQSLLVSLVVSSLESKARSMMGTETGVSATSQVVRF